MIIFIFPKEFEFLKFLFSIAENVRVIYKIKEFDNFLHIVIKDNYFDNSFSFFMKLINESDIEFNFLLNDFIKDLCLKYCPNNFNFVICGTCGSHEKEDLGKCFYVNHAIKFDRGIIKMNNGLPKLIIRPDKIKELKFDLNLTLSCLNYKNKNKILCCNYVCELSKDNFKNFLLGVENNEYVKKSEDNLITKKLTDIINVGLFDMETYDFFKVIKHNKLRCGGALRIVSDICGKEEQKK